MRLTKKAALVIHPLTEGGMCCITELHKDGRWLCGAMMITSYEDAIETALKNKLPIVPETILNQRYKRKDKERLK